MQNDRIILSTCCEAECYHKRFTVLQLLNPEPVILFCGKCEKETRGIDKPRNLEISKGIFRKIVYNGI